MCIPAAPIRVASSRMFSMAPVVGRHAACIFSGNGPGAAPAAVDRQSTRTQSTAYAAALLIVKLLCTAHWHGHGHPRERCRFDHQPEKDRSIHRVTLQSRPQTPLPGPDASIHPSRHPFSPNSRPCLPAHFGHFTENTRIVEHASCERRATNHIYIV